MEEEVVAQEAEVAVMSESDSGSDSSDEEHDDGGDERRFDPILAAANTQLLQLRLRIRHLSDSRNNLKTRSKSLFERFEAERRVSAAHARKIEELQNEMKAAEASHTEAQERFLAREKRIIAGKLSIQIKLDNAIDKKGILAKEVERLEKERDGQKTQRVNLDKYQAAQLEKTRSFIRLVNTMSEQMAEMDRDYQAKEAEIRDLNLLVEMERREKKETL